MKIAVVDWICAKDIHEDMKCSFGGMGGVFQDGMRWKDLDYREHFKPYAEALRKEIIRLGIKEGGNWHQNSPKGVPVFSDGTYALFTYRAWGDFLAGVWSEKEDIDYCYMDFYMSDWGRILGKN